MTKSEEAVPRPEYPRPQWVRDTWLCLNGLWEFEVDRDDSGLEKGLLERPLESGIIVPFCPESELSGIHDTEFMSAVWYRRTVAVPQAWTGEQLLLHFQAVDHDATVWVDGEEVARHRGGFTPFTADLGVARIDQQLTIVVRARDSASGPQARGKQSPFRENMGAFYTRTTGIWQTVWLEAVPATHLLRPRMTPDVANTTLHVELAIQGPHRGCSVRAAISDQTSVIASTEVRADSDFNVRLSLQIPDNMLRLWSPDDPFLYDVNFELVAGNGAVIDKASSYAGMRSIVIDGRAVLLNGMPLFQRLVADQGYYPAGVMTAPSEDALVRDITIAKEAGFNGARLHQKVFEERFLHHCDRLGYLVWGEFADWGAFGHDFDSPATTPSLVAQWLEVLERDYSHPSIVGWCPLNETLESARDGITVLDDVTRSLFLATKAFDRTRPVLDTSGFSHRIRGDVYDSHNYEQDPRRFGMQMADLAAGKPFKSGDDGDSVRLIPGLPAGEWSIPYDGQPYFCSEFGGILWDPDLTSEQIVEGMLGPSVEYGIEDASEYWSRRLVRSPEEFYLRFEALTSSLLDDATMFGYCYFQLYDTHQELLGIYRFDRSSKLDIRRIHAMQARPAAIERSATDA